MSATRLAAWRRRVACARERGRGEESEDRQLDAQAQARRRVALAQIRQYPDAVLRMRARDVELRRRPRPARRADATSCTTRAASGSRQPRSACSSGSSCSRPADDEDGRRSSIPRSPTGRRRPSRRRGLPLAPGRARPGRALGAASRRRAGRPRARRAARARGDGRARRPARARSPRRRADARADGRRVAPRGARHAPHVDLMRLDA